MEDFEASSNNQGVAETNSYHSFRNDTAEQNRIVDATCAAVVWSWGLEDAAPICTAHIANFTTLHPNTKSMTLPGPM